MADEQRRVEFTIDAGKAKKEIADLRKEQEKLAKSVVKGDKAFDKAAQSVKDFNDETKKGTRSLSKQANEVDGVTKEVKQQTIAFGKLADARRKAIDESGAGFAGDVASSSAGLRGAADVFGLGEVAGAPLELTEAFADLGEFLPQAAGQVRTMGEGINIAAKSATGLSGAAAGMATNIGSGIAAATGMSVAMGTMVAVALPLAAAAAGVAIAMNQYNKAAEAQRQVLAATIDANKDLRQDIAQGLTSAEAEEKLEELKRLREGEAGELGRLEGSYQSMEDQLGILSGVVKVFDSREQALADSIKEGNSALAAYDAEIIALEGALEGGKLAANDAVIYEEELAEAREKTISVIEQQVKKAESSAAQAEARANQLGEQIQSALADRAQSQKDAAEQEALEAKYAAEDAIKAEQDHRQKLAQIASDGRDRILELESGFAKLANERAGALAKVDAKGNEKLGDLRKDYFASQIDSVNDFNRETQKLNSDSAKRIEKINDDLQSSLSDASRDNNVIAFLEAQRRGEEQIREEATNAKDAEKERLQEFLLRQQEERAAFQEKQAEIIANIQSEKQAVIESYNEKRIALQEQIDAEKAAIEERKAQAEQQRQEQLQREAEQAARQAERDALREKQENEAFQRRLTELRKEQAEAERKHQEELNRIEQLDGLKRQAHSAELTALEQLETAAKRVATAAANAASASSRAGSGSSRSSSFSTTRRTDNSLRPFHKGGKIDFPGSRDEGFVFAQRGEMIVSKDNVGFPKAGTQDKGLPLSMQRERQAPTPPPMNITFAPNNQTTVGDVASKSEVARAINESNEASMSSLLEMFTAARR